MTKKQLQEFVLSLAEAIYFRYEILAHLAEKKKMPVIHLAGPAVGLYFEADQEETRVIQRCVICGEKLMEKSVSKGKRKRASFFNEGQHVMVDDEHKYGVLSLDSGILHKDSCAFLVEAEDEPLSEQDKKAFAAESDDFRGDDDED